MTASILLISNKKKHSLNAHDFVTKGYVRSDPDVPGAYDNIDPLPGETVDLIVVANGGGRGEDIIVLRISDDAGSPRIQMNIEKDKFRTLVNEVVDF